ncbi:MAG: hypothetical protein M3232_06390 [Thermoproteota archaeon]|nr:hypothetical protein [Thermoproteota archaeon]
MKIDYELLNLICEEVIAKHKSIRWAAIVNKNGVILAQKARKEAKLLLSEEENEEYAATAIARQKTRGKFQPKIGRIIYSFGRYELLHRATIPINENFYLLISLGVEEKNIDSIIMDRILQVIIKSRNRFVTMDDSV